MRLNIYFHLFIFFKQQKFRQYFTLQNLLNAKHIVEEQKDSYQLKGIVFMYHLSLKLTLNGAHALKSVKRFFNPLTPGAFCKKCVFWTFR